MKLLKSRRLKKTLKKSVRQLALNLSRLNLPAVSGGLKKIAVVLLLVGMNWTGLAAIGQTAGYLNDSESSFGNIFGATTLDFSLTSVSNFSPEVMPAQPASRSISVINDGILGFQYGVIASNSSGTLCSYLNLEANLDGGTSEYNGSLTGFAYSAGPFSDPDDWQFTITLPSNDPSLENQTCNFNFVFDGTQIGGAGFSDREIISNTVNSGAWTTPQPPTTSEYSPIADAYVNEDKPDENKGSSSELQIRSKNLDNNKRTFIKFDFNFPGGTTINSAGLELYMKVAPSASRTYDAKRVLASWKERNPDGIDWDNQPGVDGLTDSTNSGDSTPKWLFWDVTSNVQGFVSGTYFNYGWRLSDSVESATTSYEAKFHSRESTDENKRPVLEVTFIAPVATTSYPVINEVYYDIGPGKGDQKNEWVEIYNPTNSAIDISGWKICDDSSCEVIPSSSSIPSKGFAVIAPQDSTWGKWSIPAEAIKIALGVGKIGNGLANDGDRVIFKNSSDVVIDAISYGDDTSQLDPAIPLSGEGDSLARIVKGYDTDLATDWVINATPNPGTNPSIDGMEVMRFTSEGVEVAASSEEELAPLVETEAVENNASPSFSETLESATGAVTGFVLGEEEAAASASTETIIDVPDLAPVASGSIESSIEPSPEPLPEVSPEVTPEPSETTKPVNDQQPANNDSSIQAPTELAIPVEPVTVETPTEPVPPLADPPVPEQAPAPAEAPAPAAE